MLKKMTKAVEEYKSLGDRGTEMADKIQTESVAVAHDLALVRHQNAQIYGILER